MRHGMGPKRPPGLPQRERCRREQGTLLGVSLAHSEAQECHFCSRGPPAQHLCPSARSSSGEPDTSIRPPPAP